MEYHFSDKQMRLLWRSKDLKIIRGQALQLAPPSWFILAMGYFNITWVSLLTLLLTLQIHFLPAPLWKSVLGQMLVLGVSARWWWLNWNLSIRPWRRLRHAGL